jgi:hypothetical protein
MGGPACVVTVAPSEPEGNLQGAWTEWPMWRQRDRGGDGTVG